MSTPHRNQLLPRHLFIRRQITCLGLGLGVLGIALFIGIAGYHWLGELGWVDSLLNASMILGGMGPVDSLKTDAAKIFASLYALFSGIVLIGVMAIILGPSVHRVLHKFHLDEQDLQ
jgi:hypothetical protein